MTILKNIGIACTAFAISAGALGCGKKNCDDVAKHVKEVTDTKKSAEEMAKWCTEQNLSQTDIDCYMAAKDQKEVNACRSKTGK